MDGFQWFRWGVGQKGGTGWGGRFVLGGIWRRNLQGFGAVSLGNGVWVPFVVLGGKMGASGGPSPT